MCVISGSRSLKGLSVYLITVIRGVATCCAFEGTDNDVWVLRTANKGLHYIEIANCL